MSLAIEGMGWGDWPAVRAISAEGIASIILHERCGFRIVGRRERLGELRGVWRDVVLMERRSRVAGL